MLPEVKKIAVAVAQFHVGNTSEYVLRALHSLGYEAEIIDGVGLAQSLAAQSHACYLCVDSGKSFDFTSGALAGLSLDKLGFWFIDYRHNKHRAERNPSDFENVMQIASRGGWVFQSQYEDMIDCKEHGVDRCLWVPLAADPEVWSCIPVEQKSFHLGFVGNVWDRQRAEVLKMLLETPNLKFAFMGHGKAWKEDGARLIRKCAAGFNINSFFGEPYSYDVNMRVFETLSCGVPLITNDVPSLTRLFGSEPNFIRRYSSADELLHVINSALNDPDFLNSGQSAREFILREATYTKRVLTMLEAILPIPTSYS